MKDPPVEPDDFKLSQLLREAGSAPPLPPGFQDAVWQRIERLTGSNPVGLDWLGRLVETLLRPRLAAIGALLLLLAGLGLGVLSGLADLNEAAQARYLAAVAPDSLR